MKEFVLQIIRNYNDININENVFFNKILKNIVQNIPKKISTSWSSIPNALKRTTMNTGGNLKTKGKKKSNTRTIKNKYNNINHHNNNE